MATPITPIVPRFLMFRYNPGTSTMIAYKVNADDRTVQAHCDGRNHEFACSANECADGRYRLSTLIAQAPTITRRESDRNWNDPEPEVIAARLQIDTTPRHPRSSFEP